MSQEKTLCYLKIWLLPTQDVSIHWVVLQNMICLRMFLCSKFIWRNSGFKGKESKFVSFQEDSKLVSFLGVLFFNYSCLQSVEVLLDTWLDSLHLKGETLFCVSKVSAWTLTQQCEWMRTEHEGEADLFMSFWNFSVVLEGKKYWKETIYTWKRKKGEKMQGSVVNFQYENVAYRTKCMFI